MYENYYRCYYKSNNTLSAIITIMNANHTRYTQAQHTITPKRQWWMLIYLYTASCNLSIQPWILYPLNRISSNNRHASSPSNIMNFLIFWKYPQLADISMYRFYWLSTVFPAFADTCDKSINETDMTMIFNISRYR